ncbi:MAG: SH3 domain-containing protein [Spirochaetia bacterium]|jgi:hypothetical protein|nr:SH3 domain-containing protein [Spirochaetia bacterium]
MNNSLLRFSLAVIVILIFSSCSKKEQIIIIDLPATQVLEQNTNFAVITSSHLRLRVEPTTKSKAITTLWKGYILEIISRSTKKEIAEGQENYWYQINYDGLRGWIFGAYVKVYPTLEKAKEASKAMQKQ